MKKETPSWFIADYPPLKSTDDVGKAAIEGQYVEYPKIVRNDNDPVIPNQNFTNISYMLFDIPRRYKNKPIYGFFKVRGTHNSDTACKNDAYRIIREVDSKYQVRTAPVGQWCPITEIDEVVHEVYDIRESDKEVHLRDEVAKEKEKEAKKIAKELKEAEEKLKEGDIYDDETSVTFYSMKRVTEMKVHEAYQAQLLKLKQLEKTLGEQRIILKRLEQNNPDYRDQWLDVYNAERDKTKLPKFIPGETQFDEYVSLTLETLLERFPETRNKK
jgi:hypothetical protein